MPGLTENFYYDDDYRLSYSTLNGTQNLSLNYNGMGNITSRSDVAGGATWTYDPVHLHEVTEAGSTAYEYAYDANGNVTSRQGSSITWTSYNYPSTISDTATGESVSFSYRPDRRAWYEQTHSSSGTESVDHVGDFLDIVSSGGVTDYRHYIYAGSEPVAIDSRKSNGTNAFYYLLSDQEGSVAKLTNSSGTVVVGESFTAYGNRRNPTTWSGAPSGSDLTTITGITRHGYTFHDTLGQMGLNDMVGRVQDAVTGRFLSADPRIPDPANPQSYNRYSYTVDNPLTYTDPTGFDDCGLGLPQPGCEAPDLPPVTIPGDPYPPACFACFFDPGLPSTPPTWPGAPFIYPPSNPAQPTQPTQPAGPRVPTMGPGTGQSTQQQSNASCPYVACPVIQAPSPLQTITPTVQYETAPTISFLPLDFANLGNALQSQLALVDPRVAALILSKSVQAYHHEEGPEPPEPATPAAQTTERPYTPPETSASPPAGQTEFNYTVTVRVNPETGQLELPDEMPIDIFFDF